MTLFTMPRAQNLATDQPDVQLREDINRFESAFLRVSENLADRKYRQLVQKEHPIIQEQDAAPMSHEGSFERFVPMKRLLMTPDKCEGTGRKRRASRSRHRKAFRSYLKAFTATAFYVQRARGTIGIEDSQLIFEDTIKLLYWIGSMHASWILHALRIDRSARLAISAFERVQKILYLPGLSIPASE